MLAAMNDDEGALPTESLAPEGGPHELVRFRLEVVSGPDAGGAVVSSGERTRVGTHASSTLVLTDRAVSRVHLELTASGGRVTLRDAGSRNGTFVDGVSVAEAHLADGAIIRIGRSEIRYSIAPGKVPVRMSSRTSFGGLVGRSPAMRAVFDALERVAASETTVLLTGETGTGKELAAESLHSESARAEGPFVVIDCGALPKDLLEAELFGYESGAFTGATQMRKGAFETAHGGTVFLDEIGELSTDLQPKLLRVLERKEVKRLGSAIHLKVDVRVVAATHRPLSAWVNERRFRSDLYYRIAVLEVRLPPLRERRQDLPLLVARLMQGLTTTPAVEEQLRSDAFLQELARYEWPGNVRELRNYLERCIVLREDMPLPRGAAAATADGAPAVDIEKPLRESRERWVRGFERRYLEGLLQRHSGNVSAAARAAEVDRVYFHRLLSRHGLR